MSSSDQDESDDTGFRPSIMLDDPRAHGYELLELRQAINSASEEEESDHDDDDLTEYPQIVDQKRRLDYGDMHDESESVKSSNSSDGAQTTPSYSGYLYSNKACIEMDGSSQSVVSNKTTIHDVPTSLGHALSNEYDEEHLVESSSSESSPRDHGTSSSNQITGNRYSRHSDPWSSQCHRSRDQSHTQYAQSHASTNYYSSMAKSTHVDDSIQFPLSSKNASCFTRPSTYSYQTFGCYSGTSSSPLRNQSTVSTNEVKLDMPDDSWNESKGLLSGTWKKSSRLTRDSSPQLSILDQRGIPEDRNSLEAQHPDRQPYNQSFQQSPQYQSQSTHGAQSNNSSQQPTQNAAGNDSLEKKKERKKLKKEQEEKKLSKSENLEGYVGDKDLDEILSYLGESTETDSSKPERTKKKKEKKKQADSKADNTAASKNTEKKSSIIEKKTLIDKKKLTSQDKLMTQGADGNEMPQYSMKISYGQVINGVREKSPTMREIISSGDVYDVQLMEPVEEGSYSERNIDEEIEKREQEQRDFEYAQMLASQTSSSSALRQNEDSKTLQAQSLAETEFKVVQKKKKGLKEKSVAATLVPDKQSQHQGRGWSNKVPSSEAPRSATVSAAQKLTDVHPNNEDKKSPQTSEAAATDKLAPSQAATSRTSDAAKQSKTSQYDLSESSFPSLSSNVSKVKATATVAPFSYAAKAKSSAKPIIAVSPLDHMQDAVERQPSAESFIDNKELQHDKHVSYYSDTFSQANSEVAVNNTTITYPIPQSDGAISSLNLEEPAIPVSAGSGKGSEELISMEKDQCKDTSRMRSQPTKQSVEFVGFYDRPGYSLDIKFGFEETDEIVVPLDESNQFINEYDPSAEQSQFITTNQEMISEDKQAAEHEYTEVNLLQLLLTNPSKATLTQTFLYNGSFNLERTVNLLWKAWEETLKRENAINSDVQRYNSAMH